MSNEQQQAETVHTAELIPDASISLITKAEIDMQIATAHAFPRSNAKFLKDVMSLATVSPEIAESCVYALPRGGKFVEGPSVRLAEIVASCYGNLRTGSRVIYNDGKHVTAQGIVHDLEKNILHTEEVKRSILQNETKWNEATRKSERTGKMVPMNEDMQTVTGRAACSIAYRNAIFKVVPAALINDIYDKVKEIVKGTAETLVARRTKALDYFRGLGVKDEQIFDVLEIKGLEDIDLDKLQKLSAMRSALKNNEAKLDDMFPKPDAKKKADAATKATEDKLKEKPKPGNGARETLDKLKANIADLEKPQKNDADS
jgi:hypothetical protein